MGGSPGLVVMGGDSCSEGCGFKSWHHILDGHFYTYICCKNCNDVFLKRPKINNKRGWGWPIFLKKVNKPFCLNCFWISFDASFIPGMCFVIEVYLGGSCHQPAWRLKTNGPLWMDFEVNDDRFIQVNFVHFVRLWRVQFWSEGY